MFLYFDFSNNILNRPFTLRKPVRKEVRSKIIVNSTVNTKTAFIGQYVFFCYAQIIIDLVRFLSTDPDLTDGLSDVIVGWRIWPGSWSRRVEVTVLIWRPDLTNGSYFSYCIGVFFETLALDYKTDGVTQRIGQR